MTCNFDPVEKTKYVRHEVTFFQGAHHKPIHKVTLNETQASTYIENPTSTDGTWVENKFDIGNEVNKTGWKLKIFNIDSCLSGRGFGK